MKQHSRTYNSIVNSLWGIAASIVTTILNFVVRIVLVKTLGEEINGIHNLFQSIISIMTLMEMGLNTTMIIHLYAPIKENNQTLTKGIIGFYRKIYRIISLVFFLTGIILSIFVLDEIITCSIPISEIRIFFLLFVLSFSLGYLTNYRRCIIFAEQNNRISIISTTISELIFRSIQIGLLLLYHQYYIFLVLLILERLFNNGLCNHYVVKHYPFLKNLHDYVIDTDKKKSIFNTVKPLFVNQMANTVQMASRSILISLLLGNVSIVGYYGNYQLIMSVIQLIFSQIGGAFTSSFGNLSVGSTSEVLGKSYFKSSFLMNWIAAICCSCFICCSDNFIFLIFGENFIIDRLSIVILTLNLVIYLLDIPMISVQNAMGLHNLDSKYMIIQAIFAIVLGYIFGYYFGMAGIFTGLLIPLVAFSFIRKGIVISNHSLGIGTSMYLKYSVFELFKVCTTVFVSYFLCISLRMDYTFISLIIFLLIAITTSIVIPLLLSLRQGELIYAKELIAKITNYV